LAAARALVHHTTAQVLAHVVLVDRDELAPGEEALVQLHLETPVAALPGDRFIVRGFVPQEHYGTTIGGGEVLRVHAPKVRRSSEEAAARLRQVAGADPAERVSLEIAGAGPAAITRKTLGARLGLAPRAIDDALNRLVQAREILRSPDGEHYVHAETLARLEAAALAAVDAFHAAAPHKEGIAREELRSKLPRALPLRVFDAMIAGMSAVVAERDVVRRARRAAAPSGLDAAVDKIVETFRAAGLETRAPKDVAAEDPQARAAMDVALRTNRLVRVKPDYYVEKGVLDVLRDKLRAHLQAAGQITSQEWKAMTGVTRKYMIPLAEHFDAEKLTMRVGEVRKLRG
jgi:selenocysteine-specific elongation factor